MMIQSGAYSLDEVHSNLDLDSSVPFISDAIKFKGIPEYGEEFKQLEESWYKFCLLNRRSFIDRFSKAKEAQSGPVRG